MKPTNGSQARYILLVAAMLALFWSQDNTETAKAAYYPMTAAVRAPKIEPPKRPLAQISLLGTVRETIQYLPVPEEDLNPIEWVDPWHTKERWTVSWLPIINSVLESGDYPNVDAMLIMGIIAQETGGDPNIECQNNVCLGVGLMAIVPWDDGGRCGFTAAQLENPYKNILCGVRIINEVYDQAIEHGFRPGREATRAALGAYNCSWSSLLANRCHSYGGFVYADAILNYWTPLLTIYLGE